MAVNNLEVALLIKAQAEGQSNITAMAEQLEAMGTTGSAAERKLLESTLATAKARQASIAAALQQAEAERAMAQELALVGPRRAAIEQQVAAARANVAANTRLAAAAEDALGRSTVTATLTRERAIAAMREDLIQKRETVVAAQAQAAADARVEASAKELANTLTMVRYRASTLPVAWKEAGAAAEASGNQQHQAGKKASEGINSISQQMATLQRAAAAYYALLGAANSVRAVLETADAWNNVHARLKLATASAQEYAVASKKVFEIAKNTSSSLEETAVLYGRLATAGREFGISQTQVLSLTETINQATQLSGASAESSRAALIQLGQALSSGVLRGEEFNSVMEQAPRLAQAMADGLGLTKAEMRKMAEEGQLTTNSIVRALQSQTAAIKAEFATLPPTLGRAITQLSTEWSKFIGALDESKGLTKLASDGIIAVSKNLDGIAKAATFAAEVFAVALGIKAVGAVGTFITAAAAGQVAANGLAGALLRIPGLIAVTLAINGLIELYQAKQSIDKADAAMAGLGNTAAATGNKTQQAAEKMVGALAQTGTAATDAGKKATASGDSWEKLTLMYGNAATYIDQYAAQVDKTNTANEAEAKVLTTLVSLGGDQLAMLQATGQAAEVAAQSALRRANADKAAADIAIASAAEKLKINEQELAAGRQLDQQQIQQLAAAQALAEGKKETARASAANAEAMRLEVERAKVTTATYGDQSAKLGQVRGEYKALKDQMEGARAALADNATAIERLTVAAEASAKAAAQMRKLAQEGLATDKQVTDAYNAAAVAATRLQEAQNKAAPLKIKLKELTEAETIALAKYKDALQDSIEKIDTQSKITELATDIELKTIDAKIKSAKAAADKAKATGDEAEATAKMNEVSQLEIDRADAVVRGKEAAAAAARDKAAAVREEAEADGIVTQAEQLAIAQAEHYVASSQLEAEAARESAAAIREKAAAFLEEARAKRTSQQADADGFAVDAKGNRISAAGPAGSWEDWATSDLMSAMRNAGRSIRTSFSELPILISSDAAKAAQAEFDRREEELAQEKEQRKKAREERGAIEAGGRVTPTTITAVAAAAVPGATPAIAPQATAAVRNVTINLRSDGGKSAELVVPEGSEKRLINVLRDAGMVAGKG